MVLVRFLPTVRSYGPPFTVWTRGTFHSSALAQTSWLWPAHFSVDFLTISLVRNALSLFRCWDCWHLQSLCSSKTAHSRFGSGAYFCAFSLARSSLLPAHFWDASPTRNLPEKSMDSMPPPAGLSRF